MLILGIETSCDETALALYDGEKGLLGHILYSQIPIHAEYGGVVPELASRNHIRKLLPLLEALLAETACQREDISAVAYTAGPGLMGALLAGAAFAKSLAWALGIPSFGVHHMEGHLLAPMLETPQPEFPFLALLVSGGHTMLVEVEGVGQYRNLGESVDDAAGEAFDKTAQLLGLAYPGGPALAELAENGDPKRFTYPRPMLDRDNFNFSFSGLKTHTLLSYQKIIAEQGQCDKQTKADIARAFEEAVVDVLSIKCTRAMKSTGLKRMVIAGGVGANKRLRARLRELGDRQGFQVFYPRFEFCTDNGAMIAYAGYVRMSQQTENNLLISARARWPINELIPTV